jgi:hypothetical protein
MAILRGRRPKTAWEESIHDQLQKTMNWSPDQFNQQPDGRWVNVHGVEGFPLSWSQLISQFSKKNKKVQQVNANSTNEGLKKTNERLQKIVTDFENCGDLR